MWQIVCREILSCWKLENHWHLLLFCLIVVLLLSCSVHTFSRQDFPNLKLTQKWRQKKKELTSKCLDLLICHIFPLGLLAAEDMCTKQANATYFWSNLSGCSDLPKDYMGARKQERSFWPSRTTVRSQKTWIQVPALILSGCVIMGQPLPPP